MAEKMVRVIDPETKQVSRMPISELHAGMIQVAAVVSPDGEPKVEGPLFIDSASVRRGKGEGELLYPPFPERVREVLGYIQSVFQDVAPKSLDAWETGF